MEYLIVTILIVLSASFSGLTLGFFSLNLTSLERKIKLGDKRAIKYTLFVKEEIFFYVHC